MGYTDNTELINKYDFLDYSNGKDLFADLDFNLKDGVHIQNFGKQKKIFFYLRLFYSTLEQYYWDFFGLKLEIGGADSEVYYYLKFISDKKNNISQYHKHLIPKEHIIVGLFLYKVYFIDCNIELNSLIKFQRMIRLDYPDLKPGIIKTLAKVKREKSTLMNDGKIDECIKNAFLVFTKIGWIDMKDDDFFVILPSFQRLPKEFSDIINNIDSILKSEQNEEISSNT